MSQSLGLHRLRLTFFTQCISFLLVPARARDSAASHQWVGAVWLAGLAPWLANAGTECCFFLFCLDLLSCLWLHRLSQKRISFPLPFLVSFLAIEWPCRDHHGQRPGLRAYYPLDMIDVPHLVPLYCCGPTMHCAAIVVPLIRRMVRGGGLECFFVSSASSFSSSHPISSSNYLYDS